DVLFWGGSEADRAVSEDRLAAISGRVRDGELGLIVAGCSHPDRLLQMGLGAPCGWDERPAADRPVLLKITAPRRPIARDVNDFTLPRGARSEGTFAGPQPDFVVLAGASDAGDRSAWQGMVWTAGKGRVFHFAP